MSILNIVLNVTGLVGFAPRIVYIDTNDTLATVTTTGYLNDAVAQGWSFNDYDMALVTTKTSKYALPIQVNWLEVQVTAGNTSLISSAGIITAINVTAPITSTGGAAPTIGLTTPLSPIYGGTGVANLAGSTITLGGPLTLSGAFTTVFNITGNTNVTFPTSGTLATVGALAGYVQSVSGTANRITSTGGQNPIIDIAGTYVGQSSITTVGALSSGSLAAGFAPVGVTLGGTGLNSTTINQILYSSSNNVIAGLATANSAILTTTSAGVPVWSSTLTNGQLIIGSTGANPVVASLSAGSGITITPGAGTISIAATIPQPINKVVSQRLTTTGAGTYTPTTGMVYCEISMVGGGGGSGGTTGAGGQSALSGGGGGGAYLNLLATAANIGVSAAISIGVGGAAGASGNNSGGTGGTTSITINGSTWSCLGGVGGGGATASAAAAASGTPGDGGALSTGSNASILMSLTGNSASSGFTEAAAGVIVRSPSVGGASFLSPPQFKYGDQAIGNGGGSAGFFNDTGSNAAGIIGQQGIIVIKEYLSI